MRILVLIHEYPPVGGGGGRVAQDLCQGFVQHGHEVCVLTAQCGDLPAQEDQDGIQIMRLNSWRREPFRADLRAMAGYVLAAVAKGLPLIRSWKPDVIHVHFAVPAGAAAWLLSLFSGVPYVLTAHLGDVPGGVPEKTGKWFRWIFPFTPPIWKRASGVAAVSEFTRSLAVRSYPVKVQVIPNGVNLQLLDPGEIKPNRPPQIVFAGRFMPQKNPLQIVRTLAALQDLPWTCAMIGDGPLRAEVEQEIARHNLQDRFHLPGWLTPPEVIDWYRRSDILFMPSLSEGLPVVGVQALAMGLTLVLSRVGGNIDLVQPGINGDLLEPHDTQGFESALRRWLSNPKELLQARCASRDLAQRFDLQKIVDAYVQLLGEASGKDKV
jgi:glycosyltransferase involved in cell wall biosynthesis